MLNASIVPTAPALAVPALSLVERHLTLRKDREEFRMTGATFDRLAQELPKRMKAENIAMARRVIVDDAPIVTAAQERGTTHQNAVRAVNAVRHALERLQGKGIGDLVRVKAFMPPDIAKAARASAKENTLTHATYWSGKEKKIPQKRGLESRIRMTAEQFEERKQKLPKRARTDTAYRYFVLDESQTTIARAKEISNAAVNKAVNEFLARTSGYPRDWRQVDVFLTKAQAKEIKSRLRIATAALESPEGTA